MSSFYCYFILFIFLSHMLLCSHSVMFDSLWPRGLQHARLPCPSPSLWACSNSCPLIQWCHLILYCPLLLLPSFFPRVRVSSKSHFFISSGQSNGASASASDLPTNVQGWFPSGLTGLISLLSKGLSRVFSNTTVQKHQFFSAQPCLWSNPQICAWLLQKPYLWLYRPLLASELLINYGD